LEAETKKNPSRRSRLLPPSEGEAEAEGEGDRTE